jgi:hypothetical protein
MMILRRMSAYLLGVAIFVFISLSMFEAACRTGVFPTCEGSLLDPVVVFLHACAGALILLACLGACAFIRRFNWFKPWYVLLLYPIVAIVIQRLYLFLTGSNISLLSFPEMWELAFATASFGMGLVMFAMSHRRSNNASQPTAFGGG